MDTSQTNAETVEKRAHVQSEIGFPYSDLESAVDLVRTLHKQAGSACEDGELAAWLNQSVNGGTYRSRRGAARMFGLIDIAQGRISLTALGHDVLDESKGRMARAEAFLKPELYSAMYDEHRGHVLPPPPAIERQVVEMGVSPKQKERARQVLQKSAVYAGFIDPGSGRFVKPGNGNAQQGAENGNTKENARKGGGGGDEPPPHHPLIEGLFQSLPTEAEGWTIEDAAHWLQAAAYNFRYVYKLKDTIKVEVSKSSGI